MLAGRLWLEGTDVGKCANSVSCRKRATQRALARTIVQATKVLMFVAAAGALLQTDNQIK